MSTSWLWAGDWRFLGFILDALCMSFCPSVRPQNMIHRFLKSMLRYYFIANIFELGCYGVTFLYTLMFCEYFLAKYKISSSVKLI